MDLKIDYDKKNKSLSDNEIKLIQQSLDASIVENTCIPKKVLFESISKFINLQMELYQFELCLTQAVNNGRLKGYAIRQGRGGGICKAEFAKNKNKPIKVTFNNRTFTVNNSNRKILSKILESGEEGQEGNGNIFVGNKLYSLPEKLDTLAFLETILNKGK